MTPIVIRNKLIFLFLLNTFLTNSQTSDKLFIKQFNSNFGIKNVNVVISKLDTTLLTDTAGVIDLSFNPSIDTMIIKKFGYEKQIITKQRDFSQERYICFLAQFKVIGFKIQRWI